jgi:hypothetical protein
MSLTTECKDFSNINFSITRVISRLVFGNDLVRVGFAFGNTFWKGRFYNAVYPENNTKYYLVEEWGNSH